MKCLEIVSEAVAFEGLMCHSSAMNAVPIRMHPTNVSFISRASKARTSEV